MNSLMLKTLPFTLLLGVGGCDDTPEPDYRAPVTDRNTLDEDEREAEAARKEGEQLRENVGDAREDVREAREDVRDWRQDTKEDVRATTRSAGETIEEGVEDVGGAIENTADKVKAEASDLKIGARVKAAFAEDDRLDAIAINVEVEDGVVWLYGRVATLGEKLHATKMAGDQEGVKRVENELEVGD